MRSVAVKKERLEGKCHQKANAAASSSLEVFTLVDFVLFLLPSHRSTDDASAFLLSVEFRASSKYRVYSGASLSDRVEVQQRSEPMVTL